MKKAVVLLVAVAVMCIYASLGAAQCPPGNDQVLLEEMGEFVEGVWEWDDDFTDELGGAPLGYEPFKTIKAVNSRMDLRRYVGREDTRVVVKLAEVISYPVYCRDSGGMIWALWQPPAGCADPTKQYPNNLFGVCNPEGPLQEGEISCTDEEWYSGYTCPDDTHPNPCCRNWVDIQFTDEVQRVFTSADIEEVRWVEKNNKTPDSIFDSYERSLNVWYVLGTGGNPVNWWEGQQEFSDLQELQIIFDGAVPAPNSVQTIEVKLYGLDDLIVLHYDVQETGPMPRILAEVNLTQQAVYAPSGKEIRGLSGIEVNLPNINVKELDGDLVIQWPEPDAVFRPGLQLYVYVGKREIIADDEVRNIYVWQGAPSQLGTVVLPQQYWGLLKNALEELGFSEANIQIMYRTRYSNEEYGTVYTNRGHSETVSFLIQ
jgi:hypothetical protein